MNLRFGCSLDDLEDFIKYATAELNVELTEDDYDGLLKVSVLEQLENYKVYSQAFEYEEGRKNLKYL